MNITNYSMKDSNTDKEYTLRINGYILKWVSFYMTNRSPTTYTFKEPFPTGCLIAGGNIYGSSGYTTLHLQYNATSLTAYTNTNQDSTVCCWAFGY